MRILFFALFISYVVTVYALVHRCSDGVPIENDNVKISGCSKTTFRCYLKKNHITSVQFNFTPEKDVAQPVNAVSAILGNVPLPFIGVDGTDACPNIYELDGETKASCPLKAGKEYVYKNNINVLEIYPPVELVVHWALNSPEGQLMCFEVPVKIVK